MTSEPSSPRARTLELLALLACAAFVLRLLPLVVLGPELLERHGYHYYLEMADNVRAGEGLHREMPFGQGPRHAIRTPGYPLLLVGLRSVPGDMSGKVALAGALAGAGTVVLVAWLALALFGARAAVVAGGVMAFWPHAVMHAPALQDTELYTALMLASMALAVAARSSLRRDLHLAAAGGLVAAMAVLVRMTLLPLALVLPMWLALGDTRSRARRFALAGAWVLALAIGLAPWLARNQRVIGSPVLTSDTGRSLWLGNNAQLFNAYPSQSIDRAEEHAWAAIPEDAKAELRGLGDRELLADAWFRERALAHIRAEPVRAATGALRKAWATFSPVWNPGGGHVKQVAHALSYIPVMLFALGAAWRLKEHGRSRELALLAAPIVLLALQSAVFFGHSAYRSHVDPLLILLASSWAWIAQQR